MKNQRNGKFQTLKGSPLIFIPVFEKKRPIPGKDKTI